MHALAAVLTNSRVQEDASRIEHIAFVHILLSLNMCTHLLYTNHSRQLL